MSTVLVLYSTLFVNWINTAKRGNQKTPLDLFLFFFLYSFHHFICCCIGCYVFHLNLIEFDLGCCELWWYLCWLFFSTSFYFISSYRFLFTQFLFVQCALCIVHCAYSNRDQQQFTPVPQHTFWPMCSLITIGFVCLSFLISPYLFSSSFRFLRSVSVDGLFTFLATIKCHNQFESHSICA